MGRSPRITEPGLVYHVLNRRVMRLPLFQKNDDYLAFERVLAESLGRLDAPSLLAWCLMPNHWHLILWPRNDGELSDFTGWLTLTHTQRWHAHRHSIGSGHVYQGRFKSFPIQKDEHLLAVARYVEMNPIRAKSLSVTRVDQWPWSSAGTAPGDVEKPALSLNAIFPNARRCLPRTLSAEQTDSIRASIARGSPFGEETWRKKAARSLGLESTLRPRGRPRKDT